MLKVYLVGPVGNKGCLVIERVRVQDTILYERYTMFKPSGLDVIKPLRCYAVRR